MRIRTRDSRAFDRRMTDAVLESERFFLTGQHMTILTPDRRDALEFLVTFPGSFERCLQPLSIRREGGNHDMDLVCSERFFPVFWTAFAVVAQRFCAGHHSLLKLRRECLERRLR